MLGHLVLDHGEHVRSGGDSRRDAEQVEVLLVARVVDARDHLLRPVVLTGDLADDDVVLVVPGHRNDDVGRPLDAGPLEDEQLGGVSDLNPVLELGLEPLEAVAPLLDESDLVAETEEGACDIRPHLAPAGDQDIHQRVVARSGRGSQERAASMSTDMALEVGQTMRRPRVE